MQCENCGNTTFNQFGNCMQCGRGPLIGPQQKPKTKLGDYPAGYLQKCPRCKEQKFTGWKCFECHYEISGKAKKAHGEILSSAEAEELRKEFGLD